MSELVIEIHVPLTPAPGVAEGGYPFPWIDDITEHLFELEEQGAVEVYDDGEELGEHYLFFVTGKTEDELLVVARQIAARPGVPAGTFAVVTDTESTEMGSGRRVELALP